MTWALIQRQLKSECHVLPSTVDYMPGDIICCSDCDDKYLLDFNGSYYWKLLTREEN